ncbi:MAG: helicase associated domain-containing protein [Acidimicrobiales bacterium]
MSGRVAARQVEDGYRLGVWVTQQRTAYKEDAIPTERVTKLELLPGWVRRDRRAKTTIATGAD